KRKAGEKPLKVSLNSIPSIEERQEILEAIEKFAPDLPRSSDVILALQLPAEHSYTELWLQALAAPPKREKLQPLLPDAVLSEGRYRIIRKLGAGGQGFAYLAFDTNLDAEVVLKEFILPVFVDMSVRKAALKEFEKEAKILSQLDHPQIVKLLDFMVEDHRAYLVLEHIDGDSLRDRVKKNGPLDEKQVEALAGQMCTVLENLHAQEPPVVHRDFTPDNLILHKDGTLKLIDFNVAHASDTTTIAKVVGKQAYLPPEQFRGEPCPQSDVYALGCTLHYLLTGSDPVPISQSDPGEGTSERIRDLIKKATAIDLDDRYKSATEIREDLAADAAAELESDQ
ncbi:MAG TPA: serine/threonine-protein kinase, partial [Candidatus Melainabacteria bacterium]|nr:serine/threonine-protein kinase [Candidatus Melainabacteria bacterium]